MSTISFNCIPITELSFFKLKVILNASNQICVRNHVRCVLFFVQNRICSMISREEMDILKEKLLVLTKKKEDFEAKISEAKKNNEEAEELNKKIKELKGSNEDLEQKQMLELQEATNQLHGFRGADKSRDMEREEKKIAKFDSKLASLKEKYDSVEKAYQEVFNTNEDNRKQIQPTLIQIKAKKALIEKMERFHVRVPPATPIILHIEDLECDLDSLKKSIEYSTKRIPELQQEIDENNASNQLKIAEVRRMAAEVDTINLDISQSKNQITQLFSQLGKISEELTQINRDTNLQSIKTMEEQRINEEEVTNAQNELLELKKKLTTFDGMEDQFPLQLKQYRDKDKVKFNKSLQMIDQLEKKISELQQNIIQKQSESPIVKDLNIQLEKEWVQHQRLLDAYTKVENRYNRRKEDFNRKKLAISEIQKKWPLDGKVKMQKGIRELDCIYEEALVQNREMASDLVVLRDEIKIQEEINSTLVKALNGE